MKKMDKQSIVYRILIPIFVLYIIQIFSLIFVFHTSGLLSYERANSYKVAEEKNINNAYHVETEMNSRRSNLGVFQDMFNEIIEEISEKEGESFSIEKLSSDSKYYNQFLCDASKLVINAMRLNSATGGFVILNNDALPESINENIYLSKPGVYLRDSDSNSIPLDGDKDLTVLRAPIEVANKLDIGFDKDWEPMFDFGTHNREFYNSLSKPYLNAPKDSSYEAKIFGYWNAGYSTYDNSDKAISFTIPLMDKSGAVYGVFGVEFSVQYLNEIISKHIGIEEGESDYILAVHNKSTDEYKCVSASGEISNYFTSGSRLEFTTSADGVYNQIEGYGNSTYICSEKALDVYLNNSPFSDEEWCLISVTDSKIMFKAADSINKLGLTAFIILTVVSLVGIVIIVHRYSTPIIRLAQKVRDTTRNQKVTFEKTNVTELDTLAGEIENLSNDMADYYSKLIYIMDMSSRRIGAFEHEKNKSRLFISDNFFQIFNRYDIDVHSLDVDEFYRILDEFNNNLVYKIDDDKTDNVYVIPFMGSDIWVSLKIINDGKRRMGLVEDITSEVLERQKIEKERDHDFLTELLNRRAFYRKIDDLFKLKESELKIMAFLMIDLDSLKYVNDIYGHTYGDLYIKYMANTLTDCMPENAIIARLSGDEFVVVLYGFDSKEKIRTIIRELKNETANRKISLGNGEEYGISFTAGVAWYPDDAKTSKMLMKYSDFAMYKMKNSNKGSIGEFDEDIYEKESYLLSCKEEFKQLIEKELVEFYFQPIIDTRTASVLGYEAMMRGTQSIFNSQDKILLVAQNEFKMEEIERITFNLSMEKYSEYVDNATLAPDVKLFINSLTNYSMSDGELEEFEIKHKKYLHNIVVELAEQQRINDYVFMYKKSRFKSWNAQIALDDFGGGYNSQTTMLKSKPEYIKISESLIVDIDKEAEKQNIVSGIVHYGSEHNIKIIAKGVDSVDVLRTVIKLGVDYVQGEYCGTYYSDIKDIDADVIKEIRAASKKK